MLTQVLYTWIEKRKTVLLLSREFNGSYREKSILKIQSIQQKEYKQKTMGSKIYISEKEHHVYVCTS